ncbi:ATP-dependent DNA helicase [Frankliniella fusca]|uniref:ATP-dependent DNA helicase n=1 Tax=Frankliniella fusca TaxID=407009 RepID=A0AAE1LKA8_9NEOP|nr:ATP-dependent DNA helicase [Frankliniella fusca]
MDIEEKLNELCQDPFYDADLDEVAPDINEPIYRHDNKRKKRIKLWQSAVSKLKKLKSGSATDESGDEEHDNDKKVDHKDKPSTSKGHNKKDHSDQENTTDDDDQDQKLKKTKRPTNKKVPKENENTTSDDSIDEDQQGRKTDESKKRKKSGKDQTKNRKSSKKDEHQHQTEQDKTRTKNKSREDKNSKGNSSNTKDDEKASTSKSSKAAKRSKKDPEKDKGKDSQDEDSDESSSDEEVNKLNKASAKLGDFRSIKDLPVHRYFRVMLFETVNTVNGPAIRVKLFDKTTDEIFFTHLPKRLYDAIAQDIENLNVQPSPKKTKRQMEQKWRMKRTKSKILIDRKKQTLRMRKVRGKETQQERSVRLRRDRLRHRLARKCKKTGLENVELNTGIDIYQNDFDLFQKSLDWFECNVCKKRQIWCKFEKKPCKDCHVYTIANDLDPKDVPPELEDLTFVEQQLIARVHPIVSLYKVKNVQYKYTGQIINFPQNVQELCTVLPHKVEDLTGVLTIRCKNSEGFRDFFIRKMKVLNALIWLKENNPFYNDIQIDEDRINQLPEDNSVYNIVKGFDEESFEESTDLKGTEATFTVSDEEDISQDIDPISYKNIPDLSYVSQRDQLNINENVLVWPSIGKIPVNEFSSPGYITMSFPHLFCHGTCDYSNRKNNNLSLQKYVEHLMLYKDGRFAKDPRFRFFLLNSLMRWQALKLGNIFVKQNSFFNKMTIFQLKQYLKRNPGHIKEILFYSRRIKSTKAFWRSKCSELEDMVKQIGPPTIFFTLSSADFHWKDLYRLLGQEDSSQLSYNEKSNLLSENPLIVTTFFKARIQYFLKKTFFDYFEVQDFWYRTEFQNRGSCHVHGVAWLKDAPDITKLNTEQDKEQALSYFDKLISCKNPDITVRPNLIHPCSKNVSDIQDSLEDLAELVNRVQRHTCSKTYCLKRGKRIVNDCRFGFPKDLEESSQIIENDNGLDIVFERNDQLVNNYNPWVLQTWRSNIDFSPIISERILYKYIAKYASKCEYNSSEYSSVLSQLLDNGQFEDEHCKKVVRKLMIQTCAEHDYSAQEVMYLLLNFPLVNCSREFVIINLNNRNWQCINSTPNEEKVTFLDRYSNRPSKYNHVSLTEFAKTCYFYKKKLVVRKKEAIVRLFPRFKKLFYNYSDLQNACIFHVPWRCLDDFFCHEDELRELLQGSNLELNDLDEAEFECDETDDSENEDYENTAKGKESGLSYLSKARPLENPNKNNETNDVFDYQYGVKKFDYTVIQDLVKETKEFVPEKRAEHYNYDKLSNEQMEVFDFMTQITDCLKQETDDYPKRVIVQGKAGCGKSYLLHTMKQYILVNLGDETCITLGPTGVSAKNVGGSTIHSFFRLPTRQSAFKRLVGQELHTFQEKHATVKVIFIDEYSMVSCKLLAMIDQRCRELKDSNEPFGNLVIFLFGDIYQLKGVGDKALYDTLNQESWNSLAQLGKAAISSFQKSFFLTEPQRFTDFSYSNFLDRLALGNCTSNDCAMINSRCINKLPQQEIDKFEDSVRICSVNEDVKSYNNEKLKTLNTSIVRINAQNNSLCAFKSPDTYANGLGNVLYLTIGCRVMLRQNLNVPAGLVNGCLGFVTEILYDEHEKPPSLPRFIIVKFDKCEGFKYLQGGIPITPIHASWYINNISCTRVQYPLSLSWACTVHKSQSLTVSKCQLNLGDVDFELGLTYVGLSRVKNLQSFILLAPITLEHLNAVKRSRMFVERENFIYWLQTLA